MRTVTGRRPAARPAGGGRALRFTLAVRTPYRLDRTVSVLQRLPSNPVDVWASGAYLRAFDAGAAPVTWRVVQDASLLRVELRGPTGPAAPWRARLRRMLGLDVNLAAFEAIARGAPALAPLLRLARGLRPPRFASLHEAFASVIPFQQVSLPSAVAALRRLVLSLSTTVEVDGVPLVPFPSAAAIADAPPALLRRAGLSGAKARALRAACGDVAAGRLDEAALHEMATPALVERLREGAGIGPWTAGLVASGTSAGSTCSRRATSRP